MRLLHYYPRGAVGDGGISRSLRALSRALGELGVSVTIAYDEPGPGLERDDIDWWPVTHVGSRRLRIPLGLTQAISAADVLLLHSAWTIHNARAAAVATTVGTPYVVAPRGAYDPSILERRRPLKRLGWHIFERRVLSGAAALHVFFQTQEAHARALGYSGPVIVAPNGVEVPADVGWDGGTGGFLLYLGRYDPEHKGLDLLLRAIASLPSSERPVLRMHGSDWRGGRALTAKYLHELSLEPWIVMGDHLRGADKWKVLTQARGLVYPSRWEAFGNSVAEAAAAGVPVMTTTYPLGRYLDEHGGAIAVESDPVSIAEGIRRLTQPSAREIGQRGREVINRDFSWSAVAERWRKQLATLVS